jgi:hypothetical protein
MRRWPRTHLIPIRETNAEAIERIRAGRSGLRAKGTNALKLWFMARGYSGTGGGWIRSDSSRVRVAQGWTSLLAMRPEMADQLRRDLDTDSKKVSTSREVCAWLRALITQLDYREAEFTRRRAAAERHALEVEWVRESVARKRKRDDDAQSVEAGLDAIHGGDE